MGADKTYEDLEWSRIAQAVAARCKGPRGRMAELPLAASTEGAERALAETREAWDLLARGEPLPLDGIREVRPSFDRLERQGVLDGAALRDIAHTLGAARALRKFLGRNKEVAPRLKQSCALDPTLDQLEDDLSSAIETDGTVASHASSELRKLRTEVSNLRGRLVARLEATIEKRADILQDRYYTIREGRYVLPVRTDAHERLSGIVHGTSASGATVFVEPSPLVAQGNRLKMATSEMEREEQRILTQLSELARGKLAELRAAADALDHADLRAAAARFGADTGGTMVRLSAEPRLRLTAARHPLLVLDGVRVVPNDLALEASSALVISGPNAGGKTVALKVLGLAALMMRAGLPIPCAEGSECGFFEPVLTDVGDHQSIAANLSTFSAHVTSLVQVLETAGHGALVLLDELAGSTDPEEGAALACAVIETLCDAGAATAVTTHYEPLKAFAARDARLSNAAVGFDVDAMEPTFELHLGVPGSSSALAVARRFGVPGPVVERAKGVLPEQARTFDDLVAALQDQQRELRSAETALEEDRARAARAAAEAEERLERARDRERDELGRQAKGLLDAVRSARAELDRTRKQLRRERADEEALRHAHRQVEEASKAFDQADRFARGQERNEPSTPGLDPSALSPGDKVWVGRLRAEAEVLEIPATGKVRVAAGPLKVWVDRDDLKAAPEAPAKGAPPKERGRGKLSREQRPDLSPPSADNMLDVRGLRVDEAVAMTDTFLDRLYGSSAPVAYVRHGIGSGALRDAIRSHLRSASSYVRETRAGSSQEGGDRVTVVYLR